MTKYVFHIESSGKPSHEEIQSEDESETTDDVQEVPDEPVSYVKKINQFNQCIKKSNV